MCCSVLFLCCFFGMLLLLDFVRKDKTNSPSIKSVSKIKENLNNELTSTRANKNNTYNVLHIRYDMTSEKNEMFSFMYFFEIENTHDLCSIT